MDGEGSNHNSAHRKSDREGDDGDCGAYLYLKDTVLARADVGVHGQTYKQDAHELTQLLSRFYGTMCS